MAELLKGKDVASAVMKRCSETSAELKKKGITPTLAILRVGENESDLSYERGAEKRCEKAGVKVVKRVLPADITDFVFYGILDELNWDKNIHGILMFRPLPAYLDNERARCYINPAKDVDGCTDRSLGGIFTGKQIGFAPCTAEAVLETLDYYGIDPKGKNVTVIGRSLVIGKPVSMMLLNRNATVTICHTKTVDLPSVTRKADIVIAAAGQPEMLTKEYFREGQTVIDVGINWNEKKRKLCGDVLYEDAEPVVAKITPVPGGIGSVTTSVLVSHVVEAAKRAAEKADR